MAYDSDFSNHTGIQWNGSVGVVEYGGGARGQIAIFYHKAVHNPVKSQQEGRPIFDDKVFVRVSPPGERLNIVDRPATRSDQQRWPQQWALFQQNKEQTPEGTPIELLYPEKPAVAATLRANGVMTIEACAELSGNAIDSIGMGAQSWVNAAQKYVQAANKGVAITQFRKEMEEKDREIKLLQQQIGSLQQEIENLLNSKSSEARELSAIREFMNAAMGHPRRTMSKIPQYAADPDEVVDFEQERINQRAQMREEPLRKPRVKKQAVKSIFKAPEVGFDVQEDRINQSDAQKRRTRIKL